MRIEINEARLVNEFTSIVAAIVLLIVFIYRTTILSIAF